jgi:hypothetical protein
MNYSKTRPTYKLNSLQVRKMPKTYAILCIKVPVNEDHLINNSTALKEKYLFIESHWVP